MLRPVGHFAPLPSWAMARFEVIPCESPHVLSSWKNLYRFFYPSLN